MKNFIWFCIGLLTGGVGIPVVMHIFYVTVIAVLVFILRTGA